MNMRTTAALVLVSLALAVVPAIADNSRENVTPGEPSVHGTPGALTDWRWPRAVLYDNGPLVTTPGGGAGGADISELQTALGMSTYGFGHQLTSGNRIADDFVVTDAAGWQVDTITFFAYQTGSGTSSTITAVNLQIWNGRPGDAGATVVWGNASTNRLQSTGWTNIYRVQDTTPSDTNRPIMADVVTVGTTLAQGTYWLDWQSDGSASYSGPWAPPISILGQTTTGNGRQYTTTGGAWADAVDGLGTQQGFPFVVNGTVVPVELQSFTAQ